MSNPLFPNHKPEDADLSNIPGYTGHPGQDRVKADLTSQHQNSAQGQADQRKVGGKEEQVRANKLKSEEQKSRAAREDEEDEEELKADRKNRRERDFDDLDEHNKKHK